MMTEFMKGPADNGCRFQQEKNVKVGNSYFYEIEEIDVIMIIMISFRMKL